MMQMAWSIWTASTMLRMWGIATPRWASDWLRAFTVPCSVPVRPVRVMHRTHLLARVMESDLTGRGKAVLTCCALGLEVSSEACIYHASISFRKA